jgi:hypothetical protein
MQSQYTRSTTIRAVTLLPLMFLAACTAPISLDPTAFTPTSGDNIVAVDALVSDLSAQITEPLITVDENGAFQPGLAVSWSITYTADGNSIQADFQLPLPWDESSIRMEDIPSALEQVPNLPCTNCSGGGGDNPCIIPVPESPLPSGPHRVDPTIGDDHTVRVSIPLKDCSPDRVECENQILESVAGIPIYNTDVFTFRAHTNEGAYVFDYSLADGSSGTLEYDPRDGNYEILPEGMPSEPSTPICTPVP